VLVCDGDVGSGGASCAGTSCEGRSPDGSCWCDDSCVRNGDCCADRATTCDAGPTVCGGFGGAACAADEYCMFEPDASCGFADVGGVCAPRPAACAPGITPACGCYGTTYDSACAARKAGTDVKATGACGTGPDA
jgi:hypothetical protein